MANVKPIPDGYHSVTPYLIIKGAGNAIDFYKKLDADFLDEWKTVSLSGEPLRRVAEDAK